MRQRIKLTSDEFNMLSFFQNVSGAMARDCIIDDENGRIIFVVDKDQMGLAIGKNGQVIKNVEQMVGKSVDVVEYSDDPKELIKNALGGKHILEVRLVEKLDGSKLAVVTVDSKKKGAVLGRNGRNAEKARLLAKRYYGISNVHIVSQA